MRWEVLAALRLAQQGGGRRRGARIVELDREIIRGRVRASSRGAMVGVDPHGRAVKCTAWSVNTPTMACWVAVTSNAHVSRAGGVALGPLVTSRSRRLSGSRHVPIHDARLSRLKRSVRTLETGGCDCRARTADSDEIHRHARAGNIDECAPPQPPISKILKFAIDLI